MSKKNKLKPFTKISLRDYFAAQALMGLLADHKDHADECKDGESCQEAVVRVAYEFADEMMKKVNQNGLKKKKLTNSVKIKKTS